jgi:hypothetical protein
MRTLGTAESKSVFFLGSYVVSVIWMMNESEPRDWMIFVGMHFESANELPNGDAGVKEVISVSLVIIDSAKSLS